VKLRRYGDIAGKVKDWISLEFAVVGVDGSTEEALQPFTGMGMDPLTRIQGRSPLCSRGTLNHTRPSNSLLCPSLHFSLGSSFG